MGNTSRAQTELFVAEGVLDLALSVLAAEKIICGRSAAPDLLPVVKHLLLEVKHKHLDKAQKILRGEEVKV